MADCHRNRAGEAMRVMRSARLIAPAAALHASPRSQHFIQDRTRLHPTRPCRAERLSGSEHGAATESGADVHGSPIVRDIPGATTALLELRIPALKHALPSLFHPRAGADALVPEGLDPKVIAVYRSVGQLLSRYTTGKVPKAFKVGS